MTRRIIVKNIRAGIPSKSGTTSRLVELNDVTGTPSSTRSFVQWDSDQSKFVFSVLDTHDSAAVLGQINLTVDKTFVDALGVDADTVDGIHANQFLRSDTADTIDGNLTLSNGTEFIIGTGSNPLTVKYESVPNAAYFNGNNIAFADSDGNIYIDVFKAGSESIVQLRHNGNTKLATTDSGLDITGDAIISGDALLTNVDASGNVEAAGTITTSDLITFEGDSATVANLTTGIVATAAMSSVQAIEATVVSVNATTGERQVSRVLLTHDTTDTYMNEYAVINTGASDEFTLDADTSGGNFRLKLDNVSGNTLFAKSSITYL